MLVPNYAPTYIRIGVSCEKNYSTPEEDLRSFFVTSLRNGFAKALDLHP